MSQILQGCPAPAPDAEQMAGTKTQIIFKYFNQNSIYILFCQEKKLWLFTFHIYCVFWEKTGKTLKSEKLKL